MKNSAFFIWFTSDEEKNFFSHQIITSALLEEVEKRTNEGKRKVKFIDISFQKLLDNLTYEFFFNEDANMTIVNVILDEIVRNNNLKMYINEETTGFAYLYDKENSMDTLLICGTFLDYI